jgi:hypothetical protein
VGRPGANRLVPNVDEGDSADARSSWGPGVSGVETVAVAEFQDFEREVRTLGACGR